MSEREIMAPNTKSKFGRPQQARASVVRGSRGNRSVVEELESRMLLSTATLSAPTGLVASAPTSSAVVLNWVDHTTTATLGYNITRSTDGKAFSQIAAIAGPTVATYTDKNVTSGTSYYYTVQAYGKDVVSQVTTASIITTTPAAPSGLKAVASDHKITLTWTNNEARANGYLVLRSSDGVNFSQVSKITAAGTTTYADTVLSGVTYKYKVEAYVNTAVSAASNVETATAPVSVPTALIATVVSTGVQLNWTDTNAAPTGYIVLRSVNGGAYTQVAKLTSGTVRTYTDTTAAAGTQDSYEVEGYAGTLVSAASNVATVTLKLATPKVTLSGGTNGVAVAWTASTNATAYVVQRSLDGVTFTTLTTTGNVTTYNDTTAAVGTQYYYRVQATNTVTTSDFSAAVSITPANNDVAVSTRYGNELVINIKSNNNTVSVTQSGNTITLNINGTTTTQATPGAGIFVYSFGSGEKINIDGSVTIRTTVETVEGISAALTSGEANLTAWLNKSDTFSGSGVLHSVGDLVGGVSKAAGASLANPTDAGTTKKANLSLWGTGATVADVNQGSVGDCYFLSSLAAFANTNLATLREAAVDMGDGTYLVQFFKNGAAQFLRISNDFTAGYFNGGFAYAHPGSANTDWAMVLEKAWCYFRTGANTINSINAGWMSEAYSALGVGSTSFSLSSYNDTALYNTISSELASGKPVTMGTSSGTALVQGHAYTIISASRDANGVAHYVVRNPWGVSGDALENSQGFATLTFAQMQQDFAYGCMA